MPKKQKARLCSKCKADPVAPGQRWCAGCRRRAVSESKKKRAAAWNRLARVAREIEPNVGTDASEIADVLIRVVGLACHNEPDLVKRIWEVG